MGKIATNAKKTGKKWDEILKKSRKMATDPHPGTGCKPGIAKSRGWLCK